MKSNDKNFVHLVGLYAYCKKMHGAYSVKFTLVAWKKYVSYEDCRLLKSEAS